jgi:hypothetical protein
MSENQKEQDNSSGLVIYDINVRQDTYSPKLVSEAELTEAAQKVFNESTEPKASDLKNYKLTVSPSLLKISSTLKIKPPAKSENYKCRQDIKVWSSKSRSSMIARFATLDYSPMVSLDNAPVLLTLTYPKNWETLVPDAETAKRHLRSFKKRYERHFGIPFFALWKMEFQRRSAVHWHILCNPPIGGKAFKEWVSATWVDVVGETDPDERKKHLRAGTGVDLAIGLTSTDARRISFYFSKHSSPGKGSKEYQNKPPQLWLESGGSVGRYWGYWHLRPISAQVEVSREVADFLMRTLRRWHKSTAHPRKVFVWRVHTKTGVIYKRRVRRRIKRLPQSSGYLVVNDGSEIAEFLSRAIKARFN